jgi:putative glycosyltransferase
MEKEYTFILPCLNEEKTLEYCIKEIQKCIKDKKLNAEILVSDNNSTDNSVKIAQKNGARVVICKEKGYGAALINGTKNAYGKYCIMGDSDGSYDFYNIDEFIKGLNNEYELIVGNRFKGGIKKDAMSLSHKIGVKLLSTFANLLFHTPIKDYHCGLRAYKKDSIENLNLTHKGMEYASEMIIMAKINNLKMLEVPTTLRKDLRDRKPHLRTIRDGFRHLKLICELSINRKNIK